MKQALTILIGLVLLISCKQTNINNKNTKEVVAPITAKETSILKDTTFTFENEKEGELPKDWSQSFTGKGEKTDWKIILDDGNKVLAQLSSGKRNYHFNNVVYNGFEAKNVELNVRMKGFKGWEDRGGGFIWRYKDKNNYYVVRANPLEDNVVLYKVFKGRRSDLPLIGKGKTYGVDVPKLGKGWNDLKLVVIDDLFSVFLNGALLFQVKDSTFTEAGKIGLWTKADAVSYFDDYRVKILK